MNRLNADTNENPLCRVLGAIGSALLCTCLFLSTAQADPRSSWAHGEGIHALTQNLYLGADIRRLLQPGDLSVNVALTYEIIEGTHFDERAKALARLIARERPDVIGLQEVALFKLIDPTTGQLKSETDYLEMLLKALQKQGAHYKVAGDDANPAISANQSITLPRCLQTPPATDPSQPCAGPVDYLQYTDRDVMLIKARNRQAMVTDNTHFRFNLPLVVGGQNTEILRGYQIIEAKIGGIQYRIANTHLEVTGAEVGNPLASFYQQAQASELIGVLNAKTTSLPLIMLGDLNSAADDTLAQEGPNRPYQQFLSAGYVDTWAERRAPRNQFGNTCCRSETLSLLDDSPLTDRIDYVFARNDLGARPDDLGPIFSRTLGSKPWSATRTGLWPSDHAGVSSTFRFNLTGDDHNHHDRGKKSH